MTKKQKQKRKLILFGVEVVCLLFLLGILYVWSVVGKIDFNPLALGDAGINEKEFDGAGIHPGQERVHVGLGSRHHRRLQQHD